MSPKSKELFKKSIKNHSVPKFIKNGLIFVVNLGKTRIRWCMYKRNKNYEVLLSIASKHYSRAYTQKLSPNQFWRFFFSFSFRLLFSTTDILLVRILSSRNRVSNNQIITYFAFGKPFHMPLDKNINIQRNRTESNKKNNIVMKFKFDIAWGRSTTDSNWDYPEPM